MNLDAIRQFAVEQFAERVGVNFAMQLQRCRTLPRPLRRRGITRVVIVGLLVVARGLSTVGDFGKSQHDDTSSMA